jgi:hypothetical protein
MQVCLVKCEALFSITTIRIDWCFQSICELSIAKNIDKEIA